MCSLKERCRPNTPHRKIARSIHEDARDVARSIVQTPEYQQSRGDRKKVEMLFAHLKRILKLDRLRLRGSVEHTMSSDGGHGPEPTADGEVVDARRGRSGNARDLMT